MNCIFLIKSQTGTGIVNKNVAIKNYAVSKPPGHSITTVKRLLNSAEFQSKKYCAVFFKADLHLGYSFDKNLRIKKYVDDIMIRFNRASVVVKILFYYFILYSIYLLH